jgi:hypothetical protein
MEGARSRIKLKATKGGIDIQLATAETALSFLHYIPNLTNTNQTRLEINPPPAYQ